MAFVAMNGVIKKRDLPILGAMLIKTERRYKDLGARRSQLENISLVLFAKI